GDLLVLRPLAYCAEDDLAKFAAAMQFPIIPCDLCGSQDGLQRNVMKQMLSDIEARMPGRKDAMLRALAHVNPSHLLDPALFDFSALRTSSASYTSICSTCDTTMFLPLDVTKLADILRLAARSEILPRLRRLGDGDVRSKSEPADLVTEA